MLCAARRPGSVDTRWRPSCRPSTGKQARARTPHKVRGKQPPIAAVRTAAGGRRTAQGRTGAQGRRSRDRESAATEQSPTDPYCSYVLFTTETRMLRSIEHPVIRTVILHGGMARVAVSEIRFDLGVSYERYMGTWSPADAA